MIKFKWETEFKQTEIGEVPRDWEVKGLEKILDSIIKGKPPLRKLKGKGHLPYLSAKCLRGGEKALDFYPEEAGYVVDEGDILILWDGANAGEIFRGKRGLLPSTVCKLIHKKDVNKDFIYLVLKNQEKELKDAKKGTDDRHVDKEYFLTFPVPYPPPPEQSRIATVLSWFDDLIENKKRQNEILEKVAMAIFKSWFVDFDPFKDEEFGYSEELGKEIPKGWEVKAIGEVAEFVNGLSYKGSEKFDHYVDDSFVFITLNNIREGGGFKTEFAWIKSDRLKDRHFVKEGDLIFANTEQTKSGRLLATPAFIVFPDDYNKDRGVYSHHITKVSPNIPCIKPLLYLMFRYYQGNIAQTYHTGTGVWGFDLKNFKENFFTLLPPQPILQHFHSLVEPLFQKIILNQKQIMVLRKIRDALLPKFVFGKLRVVEI